MMKPSPSFGGAQGPIKFHRNHCPGVGITGNETLATWRTRKAGNLRMAFSNRRILRNERVFIRVMENSILHDKQLDNMRKATFSFTTFDPSKLNTAAGQLELHMIDIGNAMTECNLKRGAIYSFYVGDDGRIYRGSDCAKEGLVSNVEPFKPHEEVWFVARSRGNITLKFVESDILFLIPGDAMGRTPMTYVYPDLADAFAHIMKVNDQESQGSQESNLPQLQ